MVDDNLVDTKNIDDCQATSEKAPAGLEFGGRERRIECHRAENAF